MSKLSYYLLAIVIFLGLFLRLYDVQNNPPGLYIDEVSTGYNAYSILKNGFDEHGQQFPLFFRAFGEYKLPVYIYAVSGVMAIIGKSELAIRLPSIMSGVLSIPLLYFFTRSILKFDKPKISNALRESIPLIAAFLLAISSWHIHFSRGGFEATLALFLFLFGSYLALLFFDNKKYKFIFFSFIFFALSIYTYNTYRVISPLAVIIISALFWIKLPNSRKKVSAALIMFLLLTLPMIQFSFTPEGKTRFVDTSAFTQHAAKSESEKITIYPMEFLKNYLSYFSFNYLFSNGDGNGRHQLPGFGLIWKWMIPFVFIGIYQILKQNKSILKGVILCILLVAPLPAAIVQPSPHTLRSLTMVIPLTLFASVGLSWFFSNLTKFKKVLLAGLVLVVVYEFSIFMHNYYYHYPNVNSLDWGSGNKEMSEKASGYKNQYDHIVVDNNLPQASIYIKYYDDSLRPIFVDTTWIKPKTWGEERVLYIRPFYGNRNDKNVIDQVYLPGPNKDIYAQFWKL